MSRQLQPTSFLMIAVLIVIVIIKYSIDQARSTAGTVRSGLNVTPT